MDGKGVGLLLGADVGAADGAQVDGKGVGALVGYTVGVADG